MKRIICLAAIATTTVCTALAQRFTFSGTVSDTDGKPVQGVVVNNGTDFTQTDSRGRWTLSTDTNTCKFVQIATPSAYLLPKTDAFADGFYVSVSTLVREKCRHDFRLTPRRRDDKNFYFIAISDPQVKTDEHLEFWKTQTVPDLTETIDSLARQHEVVTMTLGDIVWDNMNLFKPYMETVKGLQATAFHCIGNHDFDLRYQALNNMPLGTAVYGEQTYEKHFGPVDYSFNIAGVHVVTMKNINYMGRKHYQEQLTEAQLEWLRRDLSFVPKGSMVILNMHAAAWNSVESEGNVINAKALKQVLKDYRVHVFNGHTHFFQNNQPAANIYEHNIGAACGTWWRGDVNRCGAPNGYLVVKASADSLTWQYKPTGDTYAKLMRVYAKGEFMSQPFHVVVNLWDCDSLTSVEWYEDGTLRGQMERFTATDEAYLRSLANRDKQCLTSHLFRAAPMCGTKQVTIVARNRFGQTQTETIDCWRSYDNIVASGFQPKLIAHRGYWQRPGAVQNSIAALREAAMAGVYGCELDVQLTADGNVIVNHDPHLGGLPIAQATMEQLSKVRLANGEKIPTLDNYLDEARKYPGMKIILEIKKQSNDSLEAALTRQAVELVAKHGMERQVEYISFSSYVCDQVLRHQPHAIVAYLAGDIPPNEAKQRGYSCLDYSLKDFLRHPEWIAEAHAQGLTVNIWTPDTDEELKLATSLQPDFITTDSVGKFLSIPDAYYLPSYREH